MLLYHVFIRTLACVVFVLATYNPSGYSYWDWLAEGVTTSKAAVGIIIVMVYVFLFWVVVGELGLMGTLVGLVVMMLAGRQLYLIAAPDSAQGLVLQVIGLVCFAGFLGIGLSWATVTTRLHGQVNKRFLVYAGKKRRRPTAP